MIDKETEIEIEIIEEEIIKLETLETIDDLLIEEDKDNIEAKEDEIPDLFLLRFLMNQTILMIAYKVFKFPSLKNLKNALFKLFYFAKLKVYFCSNSYCFFT